MSEGFDPEKRSASQDGTLKDYEATTDYFKTLVDVRFKLLAFLPTVTGAVVAATPSGKPSLALSLLGLTVAVALAIYEERNTEIYDALKIRAKTLEIELGFSATQNELGPQRIGKETRKDWKCGGAFLDRPLEDSIISHTTSLALIYGAVIGAWLYLVAIALVRDLKLEENRLAHLGALVTGIAGLCFYARRRIRKKRPKDDLQSLPPKSRDRLIEAQH